MLHTVTNDLPHLSEDQIVKYVIDIYQLVNKQIIKFIWSNIVPRNDNIELNTKANLINALIARELAKQDGAYISRNDNLYHRDLLNTSLFDEGGVHLIDKGISTLAQNARITVC